MQSAFFGNQVIYRLGLDVVVTHGQISGVFRQGLECIMFSFGGTSDDLPEHASTMGTDVDAVGIVF